jgi:hypothetical protein
MSDKRSRPSDVEFVKAYLAHATNAEVAAKLGLTLIRVRARARALRRRGVRLPSKATAPVSSVEELNKLVATYNKGK